MDKNEMGVFNSKIFTAFVSIFLAWILLSVISLELKKDEVHKEVKSAELRVEDIQKNSQILEKLIDNLENPAFLDKEARLRLNYKGQGEKVVFVYRDSNPNAASPSEGFSLENLSNYKKWRYYLLGF